MAGRLQYIGKYRLLKQLHVSRTGEVWEARDDFNNRRVVVKFLNRDFRRNREELGNLRREFDVGRLMHHPNVIEVYDHGLEKEMPYVVMECFNAPNLKQAIRQDWEKLHPLTNTIIEQMAAGLGYFHEQGWVHRDVKPDNFLVNETGEVKLIDFSIARKPAGGLAALFGGKVQGTRSYMAPEQIRGQGFDRRADIYSFGCTLFELTTGRLPYTGVSADDLLSKHLRAAVPSPVTYNELVTPEFAALSMRAMAKKKEDRFQKMDDFLNEFRSVRVFRARPTSAEPSK